MTIRPQDAAGYVVDDIDASVCSRSTESVVPRRAHAAWHEAGHAVVGLEVGLCLVSVDVEEIPGQAGLTSWAPPPPYFRGIFPDREEQEWIVDMMVMAWAGIHANYRALGSYVGSGVLTGPGEHALRTDQRDDDLAYAIEMAKTVTHIEALASN